uniref:uncharacterized protein n=2 Tax=Pristiophorus japonicus TaxID=55135 RepID=UPI00398F8D7B
MSEALSQASVRWRRGGSPVQVSDRIGTEDQGRTLRIKALEVRDRGAWECHVSYDGKTINVPYTLEIFGFAGPKEEIPTTYAGLGAPARLCLGLAPTVPEGRVQAGWLRGNGTRRENTAAIPGSRLVSELGSGHLTLTLLPVLPSDRGLYTGYLNVSGRRIERTVRLALAQVVASRPGPVSVGSALRLEVNTSYPEGVETVECRRENGSAGDEEGWTREADGSLYIARVTASQAGNWTCNLYRHGGLVGSVGYLLDVSALDYSVGDPNLSSNRITLLAVFTLLLLLIVFTIFFIQRTLREWAKSIICGLTLSTVTTGNLSPPPEKQRRRSDGLHISSQAFWNSPRDIAQRAGWPANGRAACCQVPVATRGPAAGRSSSSSSGRRNEAALMAAGGAGGVAPGPGPGGVWSLQAAAARVESSEAALKLFVSLVLGYPFAFFHRRFLHGTQPYVTHFYNSFLGLWMAYFNFGGQLVHSLVCVLFQFLVLRLMGRRITGVATSFIFQMIYLLAGYYYTATDQYDIKWTMPHCVLTLKLIGLSLDYYDGGKDQAKLSKEQQTHALEGEVSLAAVVGYAYFYGAFLVGPQFSMRSYQKMTAGQLTDTAGHVPNSVLPAMKRLLLGMTYVTGYTLTKSYFPDDYLLTSEFANQSLGYKCLFIALWGKVTLSKYVSCWLVAVSPNPILLPTPARPLSDPALHGSARRASCPELE